MRDCAFRREDEEVEKFHKFVLQQSKLMSCKMKDLLDQGLIEHGSFLPNNVEFKPNKAISKMVTILKLMLELYEVEVITNLDTRLDTPFIGDMDRIQQVMLNLMTNASKFVPKHGGFITVESQLKTIDAKNFIQIEVSDNGPGIPPRDISKLFKPFIKLSSTSQLNPTGNGLGLSICKLICNSLGGDIKASSQQDVRTTFFFWVLLTAV